MGKDEGKRERKNNEKNLGRSDEEYRYDEGYGIEGCWKES